MKLLKITTFVYLLFMASQTNAAIISLVPKTGEIQLGESLDVDIVVSDLGDVSAPSLAAYDIDVLFDESVFAFEQIRFQNELMGDVFGNIQFETLIDAGWLNVFELSFAPAVMLDLFQPKEFTLATLSFNAKASGVGQFSTWINSLSDALGNGVFVDNVLTQVTVLPALQVNEPFGPLILLFGLLALIRQQNGS